METRSGFMASFELCSKCKRGLDAYLRARTKELQRINAERRKLGV